jgi:hypothetical protein
VPLGVFLGGIRCVVCVCVCFEGGVVYKFIECVCGWCSNLCMSVGWCRSDASIAQLKGCLLTSIRRSDYSIYLGMTESLNKYYRTLC